MHRHQLDCGNAQLFEIADDCGMRQTGIGPALFWWDLRHCGYEALDVGLIDDGLVEGSARRRISSPVEAWINHDAARNERRTVAVIRCTVDARIGFSLRPLVSEDRLVPRHATFNRTRVRIEEKFGRIRAQAVSRGSRGRARESRSVARASPRASTRASKTPWIRVSGTERSRPASSNRQSSTLVATSENNEKLVPRPSNVAPSGNGSPGQTADPGFPSNGSEKWFGVRESGVSPRR